jgi:hypothetical protein
MHTKLFGNLKGRYRRRWEDNIKMNIKSCRGLTHLALEIPDSFEHENGSSCFNVGEKFFDFLSE